jgi:hypothetical protein
MLMNLLGVGNLTYQKIYKSIFFVIFMGFFAYNMENITKGIKSKFNNNE